MYRFGITYQLGAITYLAYIYIYDYIDMVMLISEAIFSLQIIQSIVFVFKGQSVVAVSISVSSKPLANV